MHYDAELDASGLSCPLPLLRMKKALTGLASGQVLRIIATDPGAPRDFEAYARQAQHELLETSTEGGKFYFLLKKG